MVRPGLNTRSGKATAPPACSARAATSARISLPGGKGEGDRAAVAVAVDGADAEQQLVLGEAAGGAWRQLRLGDLADVAGAAPRRRGGVAPDHLVARDVG